MNFICNKLPISYALAYVHIFGDTLTPDHLGALRKAAMLFKEYQKRLALVIAPYSNQQKVIERITGLCVAAGVPASCKHIIELLAHDNRLDILTDVLYQIGEQYKLHHHLENCSITSSHELTERERAIITSFLARKTTAKLIPEYTVDATLIAGVKIVSDTLFWEYSLRRYLAKIYCKLIR